MIDALRAAAETSPRAAAELAEYPDLPDICIAVWGMFLDLNATRPSGFGVSPIQYQEIEAYDRLLRRRLSPEEVYLIRVADAAALEQIHENHETKTGTT